MKLNSAIGILFSTFFLGFFSPELYSREKKPEFYYPVSSIDSSLRKNALAVCREYQEEFRILSPGSAVQKIHMVITILEKGGEEMATLVVPYDKSTKVTSISGKSYNLLGQYDEKLKNNSIMDVNYTSDGAIYDDLRYKLASFSSNSFPATIEYNYEISHTGLIGYPTFMPQDHFEMSVESATFTLSCPDTMKVRFKEFKIPEGSKTERKEDGRIIYEWKIGSLKAMKDEPYSPNLSSLVPRVLTGPNYFEYENTKGYMDTWSRFGNWISSLTSERDRLPEFRVSEIRKLVEHTKDTLEIVNILYKYMQKKTHYVGIQLGIGGFQPIPAETVDRLGYGDCKALSNYMKALLSAAGIRSIYTIAGTATNAGIVFPDFPTINQNNHVILCVPIKKDTIWLECTSQYAPTGFLGSSTAGRKVLLITPSGGKFAMTPLLDAMQNLQSRHAEIELREDGSIFCKSETTYSGYQYNNVSHQLTSSREDQEKSILRTLGINGAVLTHYAYRDLNRLINPSIEETLEFSSNLYTTTPGSRIFLPINAFNPNLSSPIKPEERKLPFTRNYAYHDVDTLVYHLPAGYVVETIPTGKSFDSEFGKFTAKYTLTGSKLSYVRDLQVYRGTWPKEKYGEYVDFLAKIVNSDKGKLVLKKQLP